MLQRTALATALLIGLTSCGGDSGGGSTTPPPPTPVATTISVTSSSATLDAIGATAQLTAQVRDQNGAVMAGQSVSWASDASGVATVSAAGLVTAVSTGSATIRATAGSASGSVAITVDQAPAAVSKVSGDVQTGVVGTPLANAISITVQDSRGNAVPGEGVTFSVTGGGGTIDPTSATTSSDGTASTTWTLGTDASETQSVRAAVGSVTADFTAVAQPGSAESLTKASGDGQAGVGGTPLPEPLVVRLTDAFGNPLSGVEVGWATGGDGTLAPSTGVTDSDGAMQTQWTLATAPGVQTATASGAGLQAEFTATSSGVAVAPTITQITPATLIAGQAATITGTGFAQAASSNSVLIDGQMAAITGASATSLDITVPVFGCVPARSVQVSVTSNGLTSAPADQPLHPEAFTMLVSGEQTVLSGGGDVCVQLPADGAGGDYLLGVQRVTQDGTDLLPVRVSSVIDPAAAPSPALVTASDAVPGTPLDDPAFVRQMTVRAAEGRMMEINRETIEAYGGWRAQAAAYAASGGGPATSPPAAVPSGEIGDEVTLKVRDFDAGATCDVAATITATIAAKSDKSIWFLDNANPADGFTNADVQGVAANFDSVVLPAHTGLFGPLSDVDGDGRVAIIISRRLNQVAAFEIQGFVSSCDFTNTTASSNFGEVFYSRSPDPSGEDGRTLPVQQIIDELPFVAAHEVTHIKQLYDRLLAGRATMNSFLLEGQATSSEEVVGHAVLGNQEGQNYGFDVAFNSSTAWYTGQFADLAAFFGVNPGSSDQIPGTPEACTWVDDLEEEPCIGRALWYGVTASYFRWVVDNLLPGQAGAFHQSLIDSPLTGFALIEAVIGQPMVQTMPPWSAALYLDDRAPVHSSLTFSSWNLLDIFEGGGLIETARLIPRFRGLGAFSDDAEIRGGSTAYWRISGGMQPGTAIRVRLQSGDPLPGEVVVYVVPVP